FNGAVDIDDLYVRQRFADRLDMTAGAGAFEAKLLTSFNRELFRAIYKFLLFIFVLANCLLESLLKLIIFMIGIAGLLNSSAICRPAQGIAHCSYSAADSSHASCYKHGVFCLVRSPYFPRGFVVPFSFPFF